MTVSLRSSAISAKITSPILRQFLRLKPISKKYRGWSFFLILFRILSLLSGILVVCHFRRRSYRSLYWLSYICARLSWCYKSTGIVRRPEVMAVSVGLPYQQVTIVVWWNVRGLAVHLSKVLVPWIIVSYAKQEVVVPVRLLYVVQEPIGQYRVCISYNCTNQR